MVKWVTSTAELSVQPDANLTNWLTKPYVLSQTLKVFWPNLTVRVLSQGFFSASEEEAQPLAIPANQLPFIRQVLLEDSGIPLTYGRVIIPLATYQKYQTDFESLGNRPLGETLLYRHPYMTRSAFEYAVFSNNDPFMSHIETEGRSERTSWGRRSVFRLAGDPLMVTELFLTTFPDYPG